MLAGQSDLAQTLRRQTQEELSSYFAVERLASMDQKLADRVADIENSLDQVRSLPTGE